MIRKLSIWIIIVLNIFMSCNSRSATAPQSHRTIINGEVLEKGTNIPIDSVKVSLYRNSTIPFAPSYSIEKHYTDNNGKFYIDYLFNPTTDDCCIKLSLHLYKQGYYIKRFYDLNEGETIDITLYIGIYPDE